ncbi:MAG: hypothetical protein OET57_19355, partial [Desulfobacteraceae bacterium]|nr:hypothetical protein [Desulfobacteraceae bacterium]
DCLSHPFIRFGLTRAKALQTVIRFPREIRRRSAASKSNAFTLRLKHPGETSVFTNNAYCAIKS